MKKVFTLVLICILLTSFIFAYTVTVKVVDNSEDSDTVRQETCTTAGGTWKEFSNGCRDSCRYARNSDILCTQAFTMGCDCGENECWDGEECENNNEDETEIEDDDDEEDERERIREKTRERIRKKSGFEVETKREIEVDENGNKVIKIKRKITNADGTETEIEVTIKITGEGITKKIKIESEDGDFEVESELQIEQSSNGSQITITKTNGETVVIDILPDAALEIARQRLRFKKRFRNMNMSDISINLEEIEHKNIPRVVYNIQTNQHGRFLGIFKLVMNVEAQIDPETGEVIDAKRPWWAFLVAVSQDQTEDDEEEDDSEDDNENEDGTLTYEEALIIAQESDCVLEGDLTEEYNYNSGTKTWWIDMNMFEEMEGCSPACVVSEETMIAEMNYRCTGLLVDEAE